MTQSIGHMKQMDETNEKRKVCVSSRSPSVAEFLTLQKDGFGIVSRAFSFTPSRLKTSLGMSNGRISHTVEGTDADLFLLASSLEFGRGPTSLFFVNPQIDLSIEDSTPLSSADRQPIAGLTCAKHAVDTTNLFLLETRESTTHQSSPSRIWLSVEDFAPANPILDVGDVNLSISFDGLAPFRYGGFIDCVIPFHHEGRLLLELRCNDLLSGFTTQWAGVFNAKVNPLPGIYHLLGFADTSVIFSDPFSHADIVQVRSLLPSDFSTFGPHDLREMLKSHAKNLTDGRCSKLASDFLVSANINPDTTPLVARSFANAVEILLRKAVVWVVIGAIPSLRIRGIVQVGPNVALVDPQLQPFVKVAEDGSVESLCAHWDSECARVLTFCSSKGDPVSKKAAERALLAAVDWIAVALADTSWRRLSPLDGPLVYSAHRLSNDARIVPHDWYHTHELYRGTTHQYWLGHSKSSDVLTVDPLIRSLIAQKQMVFRFLNAEADETHKDAQSRIRNCLAWILRSRSSRTKEEEFLCLWISMEFLVVRAKENASSAGEKILTALQRRLPGILGSNPNDKKLWNRRIEEWYRTRCSLVHHGGDGVPRLDQMVDLLRHAALMTVLYAIEAIQQGEQGDIPAILETATNRHGKNA